MLVYAPSMRPFTLPARRNALHGNVRRIPASCHCEAVQQPPHDGDLEGQQAQHSAQHGLLALVEEARGEVHVATQQDQLRRRQHQACAQEGETARLVPTLCLALRLGCLYGAGMGPAVHWRAYGKDTPEACKKDRVAK